MKKKGLSAICIFFILMSVFLVGASASAKGADYERIEDTECEEVIEITESVSEIYPICPELIQAIVFYESSNRRTVVSKWGDVGYMQVNPRWQKESLKNLGIKDLINGYSKFLAGTDLLYELFQKYNDVAMVLMAYNVGEEKAMKMYESGEISDYARKIMDLSEKLERLHGK